MYRPNAGTKSVIGFLVFALYVMPGSANLLISREKAYLSCFSGWPFCKTFTVWNVLCVSRNPINR
jgi:hypothetical protein